jgi:hypothetical protein
VTDRKKELKQEAFKESEKKKEAAGGDSIAGGEGQESIFGQDQEDSDVVF